MTNNPIGVITKPAGALYIAECFKCSWRLRKRRKDDAAALLRSHHRIAHPWQQLVYAEGNTK